MATAQEIAKRRAAKRQKSHAKERAQRKASGFTSSTVALPSGVEFFETKVGSHQISILGYEVGKGNPEAKPGDFHYERTFYVYKDIGPEKNWYTVPSKVGLPDPVQEWRTAEAKKPGGGDVEGVKLTKPRERQLFLLYDHSDKKIKLWDVSYNLFGELLDQRVNSPKAEREGWDLFYFPDEDGWVLDIQIADSKTGAWTECVSIDFTPLDPADLPDEAKNHGICLDNCVVIPTYAQLKSAFLGVSETDVTAPQNEPAYEEPAAAPAQSSTPAATHPAEVASEATPAAAPPLYKKGDIVTHAFQQCSVMKVKKNGTYVLEQIGGDEDIISDVPEADISPAAPEKKEAPAAPAAPAEPAAAEPDSVPFETDDTGGASTEAMTGSGDDEWAF